MPKFKTGQRVKRARKGFANIPIGATDTVTNPMVPNKIASGYGVGVDWDNLKYNDGLIAFMEDTLEPLLPPDTWAANKVREVTKPMYTEILKESEQCIPKP